MAVTIARRVALAEEYAAVTADDPAVKTAHPLAREYVVDTLLTTEAAAQAEASRVQALRGVPRVLYELALEYSDETRVVELGDVIRFSHPRLGLSAGKLCVVVGIVPDLAQGRVTLTVWG